MTTFSFFKLIKNLFNYTAIIKTQLCTFQEDTSSHVPMLKSLQEICDGTALAALISFYCPDAIPRTAVRVGRMASIQDCLHNLMLVYEFCRTALPHNVFHMMPEDVTYMRGLVYLARFMRLVVSGR